MIWTQEQRTLFAKALVTTSKLYDRQIDIDVAKMVLEDLGDLDFERCMAALVTYRREPKNKTWPKAADIRSIVHPKLSVEGKANECAARIREAISKFGYSDGAGARAFIGELGWKVVGRSGGWLYLCENHGSELSPLTFHAQARDLAKALLESFEAGVLDVPIGLPEPEMKGIPMPKMLTNSVGAEISLPMAKKMDTFDGT